MTFSGKMCLKIILKVTKTQGFTLSLEDKLIPPHPSAVLGLKKISTRLDTYKKY